MTPKMSTVTPPSPVQILPLNFMVRRLEPPLLWTLKILSVGLTDMVKAKDDWKGPMFVLDGLLDTDRLISTARAMTIKAFNPLSMRPSFGITGVVS